MPIRRPDPPLDYLHSASVSSLESYELSRLNHAANLRREIATLLDQWIEETVHAHWPAGSSKTAPCNNTPLAASPSLRRGSFPSKCP